MTGEHYIGDTVDIRSGRKILGSTLQTMLKALDQKAYDTLNGVAAHNYFKAPDFSSLTITSGIVTVTAMCHILSAETGTADVLDTINMAPDGVQMLLLRAASGHTITISHNVGNIKFASGTNYTLSGDKFLLLFRFASTMYDTATSATAGSSNVSSVALSAPSIFSVAGSPITTSGTLALTLATQVKNKIFVGPATGSDAAPTFRLMVLADLPSLAATKLLGNPTGSSAAPAEITIGSTLQITGTTLDVVGGAAAGGEGESGNLVTNGGFKVWERGISAAPDNWVLTGTGATVAQEGTIVKMGDYSAKVTRVGNDCHLSFDAYPKGHKTYMRGRTYVLGAWVYATVPSRARLRTNDGTTTTYSSYHSGGSTWEWLTVSVTVGGSATVFNVGLAVDTGNTAAYVDGVTCVEGTTLTYPIAPALEVNQYPKRARVSARTFNQPSGTVGIATAVQTSQLLGGYSNQVTSANGDEITTSVFLAAGTYTLYILGSTNTNAAKLDWYVDNVLQGGSLTGQDWYSGSQVFNVVKTGTITVVGDGYHVIKGKVNGRNASNSTGYYWLISELEIYPSVD